MFDFGKNVYFFLEGGVGTDTLQICLMTLVLGKVTHSNICLIMQVQLEALRSFW